MIAGIVLAAGLSRRMGRPKALLRLDGATFLERAVAALAEGGCAPVLVVTGPEEDETAARIAAEARRLGAWTATNPRPGSEQVDSLRVGLTALPAGVEAAAVLPVDVPLVSAAAVRAVVGAFREEGGVIVRAAAEGRHGHPVLFARAVWPELMAGPLPEGARTVIHADPSRLREVETGDPGVLEDVDTPGDFRRLGGTE